MSPLPGDARTPRHHPSDDLLLCHAAGRLPPVPSLLVSTHLPFCPRCRDVVAMAESIGGLLLADIESDELKPNALTRTLSRLEVAAAAPSVGHSNIELLPGVPLPEALRGLVRPRWRWLAPGIRRITVDMEEATVGERVYLLRIAPGMRMPEHGHEGWEATCVLDGRFSDETGDYDVGDVAETDGSVHHQPVAGADTGCVCLIVCQGRLKLRGVLARLLQPFVGV